MGRGHQDKFASQVMNVTFSNLDSLEKARNPAECVMAVTNYVPPSEDFPNGIIITTVPGTLIPEFLEVADVLDFLKAADAQVLVDEKETKLTVERLTCECEERSKEGLSITDQQEELVKCYQKLADLTLQKMDALKL